MAVKSICNSDQQPSFVNNSPPNLQRLNSVFERGLCGSLALKNISTNFQSGYDEEQSYIVYFNGVSKADKLHKAMFDPADGVYHISLEYAGDQELVKTLSNETRVNEVFSKKVEKIPPAMQETYSEHIKGIAFVEALRENSDLLKLLASRSDKVAVLILDNIDLTQVEKEALSVREGFMFFERKIIEPQKIQFILMSEKLKDNPELVQIRSAHPNVEFQFAPSSYQEKVPYSYKEKQGNISMIRNLEVNIEAPDFLPQLTEIFSQHFAKDGKPMFIHALRL